MKLIKAFVVASRGRNPQNPNDRTKGIYLEQRFEVNWGGVADFSYPDSKTRRGRVQGNGQICPTITSEVMMICRIEKRKTNEPVLSVGN